MSDSHATHTKESGLRELLENARRTLVLCSPPDWQSLSDPVVADIDAELSKPVSTPIPLTPSDEMVEAACKELRKWQNFDLEPDEMKAILSAALNLMGGKK